MQTQAALIERVARIKLGKEKNAVTGEKREKRRKIATGLHKKS